MGFAGDVWGEVMTTEERVPVWVVIAPEGHFTYATAFGRLCHDDRSSAISEARRFARWAREDGDWIDDPPWKDAQKAGWRVRKAYLVVPSARQRKG
jgi:hypothetical protein